MSRRGRHGSGLRETRQHNPFIQAWQRTSACYFLRFSPMTALPSGVPLTGRHIIASHHRRANFPQTPAALGISLRLPPPGTITAPLRPSASRPSSCQQHSRRLYHSFPMQRPSPASCSITKPHLLNRFNRRHPEQGRRQPEAPRNGEVLLTAHPAAQPRPPSFASKINSLTCKSHHHNRRYRVCVTTSSLRPDS